MTARAEVKKLFPNALAMQHARVGNWHVFSSPEARNIAITAGVLHKSARAAWRAAAVVVGKKNGPGVEPGPLGSEHGASPTADSVKIASSYFNG